MQQTGFVFPLFYSIYCICLGNFDTSTYYLPLRTATPFNNDSLLGWYQIYLIQFCAGITYMFSMVATLYFVGCCFYLEALCDHFDYLIESIDNEFHQDEGASNVDFVWKNSLNARKHLSNVIDHHNMIYE